MRLNLFRKFVFCFFVTPWRSLGVLPTSSSLKTDQVALGTTHFSPLDLNIFKIRCHHLDKRNQTTGEFGAVRLISKPATPAKS